MHDEVATKQFMEELRELTKTTHHENVRDKILELIQAWAHAFRYCSFKQQVSLIAKYVYHKYRIGFQENS